MLLTNGRPRGGLHRRSPAHSQPQSQSSSEMALSITRTDSGRTYTTDISEASTTEDYVTANTSTGTGTASATTSSWSKPGPYQPSSSTAPSGPTSTTTTAADGSSFESASSIYSLARSEVNKKHSNKSIFNIKKNCNIKLISQRGNYQNLNNLSAVFFFSFFFLSGEKVLFFLFSLENLTQSSTSLFLDLSIVN